MQRIFSAESGFKKSLCLSEITQKKGVLTENEEALMKACGCVWGCDICQDVCPMNKDITITPVKEFKESPVVHFSEGDEIEGRAFAWRTRKVIERNMML